MRVKCTKSPARTTNDQFARTHQCTHELGTWLQKPFGSLGREAFVLALRQEPERWKQSYFEISRDLPPPTPLPSKTGLSVINCLCACGGGKGFSRQGRDLLIEQSYIGKRPLAKGAKCPLNGTLHFHSHGKASREHHKPD